MARENARVEGVGAAVEGGPVTDSHPEMRRAADVRRDPSPVVRAPGIPLGQRWRTRLRITVHSFLSLSAALWAGTAWAQSDNSITAADLAAMRSAREAHQRQESIGAIDVDRSSVVAEVVGRFSSLLSDGGDELRRALAKVPAEVVVKASEARSVQELDRAFYGKAGGVEPHVLGSPDSDLVFFPVAPCRLADTRVAGGILTVGVPRDFDSNGGDLSPQGGSATGCGVNDPDPAALAVTITSAQAQGAGNFRAWPLLAPVPNASVVNYGLPGQGLNLANTTILPVLQSLAQVNEFSVRADGSAAHVVIDVVGYFFSPRSTAPQCQTLTVVADHTAGFTLTSPVCPATYTLTGGGHNWAFGNTGVWFWQSAPNAARTAWQVRGFVDRAGGSSEITAFAICCRVPGR
jgi:hypothetical protein